MWSFLFGKKKEQPREGGGISGTERHGKAGPAVCAADAARRTAGAPAPPPVAPPTQGRNVSGRLWKPPRKAKGGVNKADATQTAASSWAAKEERRRAKQLLKEREAELIEAKKERKAREKEKKAERKARRQRNEMKNTITQEIRSPTALKTMSKKQLRQVKRTRVSKEGEVELVDAYAPTNAPAKRHRR